MLLLVASCGDGSGKAPDTADAAARSDADAGPDAGGLTDDAGPGLGPRCKLSGEALSVAIDSRNLQAWSATMIEDTVHVAYQVPTCTQQVGTNSQQIQHLSFSSSGPFEKPTPVADSGNVCSSRRGPALAEGANSSALLFFASDEGGRDELYKTQVGSKVRPLALTENSPIDQTHELTQAIRHRTGHLLAYVKHTKRTRSPSEAGLFVSMGDGKEIEVLSQAVRHVADLSLMAFDAQDRFGWMLAWVVDEGDSQGIFARVLDKKGTPIAPPVRLASQVGPMSNVALAPIPRELIPDTSDEQSAGGELAGAVAYSVRIGDTAGAIRFRPVGRDGTLGEEVRLTTPAVDARGVDLTFFAGGYALVYRTVVDGEGIFYARILSLRGNMGAYGQLVLTRAAAGGSAPEVLVTSDGRFNVIFSDISPTRGTELHIVRGLCDP